MYTICPSLDLEPWLCLLIKKKDIEQQKWDFLDAVCEVNLATCPQL